MNRLAVVSLGLALLAAGCSKQPKKTSSIAVRAAEQKITATATSARDRVRGAWKKVSGPSSDAVLADSAPAPEKPSAAVIRHRRRK